MTTTTRARGRVDLRDPVFIRADAYRDEAESLLRGMEVLTRKFGALDVVPLDLLDRAERIVVGMHASNLLRVAKRTEDELLERDA